MTLSVWLLKELVLIAVIWIVIFTKRMFFWLHKCVQMTFWLFFNLWNWNLPKRDLNWTVRAKNFNLGCLHVESWWFLKHNFGCKYKYSFFVWWDTIFVNLTVVCNRLPYLPMCKLIPCISQPFPLKPKNKFFLFLGKNFLDKLFCYLRIFFQYPMVTWKICPELFFISIFDPCKGWG